MTFISILPSYVIWHYGQALRDGLRVWTNFMWFLDNFFSLSILLKTFFAPWKRIQETRGKLSLENIAETVVTNTIMRLVGALMRAVVLIIGGISILTVFWIGVACLFIWLCLPALIPVSVIAGIASLIP